MSEIQFFGKIDRKQDGKVLSEYPAWYFENDNHVLELKESIDKKERELEKGVVSPEETPYMRNSLKKEKKRLEDILSSKPKLNEKQTDFLSKTYKELKERISDSMFTRSDMMLGRANPHEEAKRMVNPCIEINPEIAEACNIRVTNGKTSRNEASKVFKIIGRYLGEDSNVEYIRKDKRTR